MTPARQRRRPTLHRGRLQHCCAFLSAITPPEARPPDRFAYQVMIPAHRHARGLGHGPAARPPDLISLHLGEAGAAGQRGASSGCSTAARSCLRSPAPGSQAAGPGCPPGDGPCLPSSPGTWPWFSSTPTGSDLAPPGEAGAAGQRGASSGCSTVARSCLRSPAPGARPPDRVAHQVMALSAVPPGDMAQQRPTGDPSSATSPADTAPREVAALLRVPAGVHTPLRARPPDG